MKKSFSVTPIKTIRKYRLHSLFVKFFVVFFLLMTIPVAAASAFFAVRTRKVIWEQSSAAYAQMLKDYSIVLDAEFSKIKRSANDIVLFSPYIILKYAENINADNGIHVINMIRNINQTNLLFDLVDNTFIYFKRMDRMLFRSGGYSVPRFAVEYLGGDKRLLTEKYYDYSLFLSEGSKPRSLMMAFTPGARDGSHPPSTQIFFTFRLSSLESLLQSNHIHREARVMVLLEDGTVLVSGDGAAFPSGKALVGLSGSGIVEYEGIRYFTTVENDSAYGLVYIAFVPEAALYAPLLLIQRIAVLTVAAIFFIAVIVSFFMSAVFYRPVSFMINTMVTAGFASENARADEYFTLTDGFRSLLDEKEAMQKLLKISELNQRDSYAHSLIFGARRPQETLSGQAGRFFQHDRFKVMIVRICNRTNEVSYHMSMIINAIHSVCRNMPDLLSTQTRLKEVIVIAGMPPGDEEYADLLIESFRVLIGEICPDICGWFGVSETLSDLSSAQIGYEQANDALQCRDETLPFQTVHFGQIKEKENTVFFPEEKERALFHALMAGDADAAVKTARGVYHENRERHVPYFLYQRLFELFFIILQRAVDTLHPASTLDIREFSLTSDEDTPTERMARVERLCGDVCRLTHTTTERKLDEIKDYIRQHLKEDISLDILSEMFSLSPSYISRKFKGENNESLVAYINKVRISRAKELLAETEDSVQDISASTGYLSGNTFARTFRQYEGISPSEYRAICRQKGNEEKDREDRNV